MTADQLSLVEDLLQVEGGLSARAMDFIESLEGQPRLVLSPKQTDWLEKLGEQHL